MPTPPPGWHPDPGGAPMWRWWDGQQWTNATAPYPPPSQKPNNTVATVSVVLAVLLVVILYVVFHQMRYEHCLIKPGMFEWPRECL